MRLSAAGAWAGLRCAFVLGTLACAVAAARADCVAQSGARLAEDTVYRGYTPTGYKGALERDLLWHQDVRAGQGADGEEVFHLRRRPRAAWDSLEPWFAGARHGGWLASKDGCRRLLDVRGEPFPVPPFDEIWDAMHPAPRGVRLYATRSDTRRLPGGAQTTRLLVFQGTRLRAVSAPYRGISGGRGITPDGTAFVRAAGGRVGLLDLRTARELMPPRWVALQALSFRLDGRTDVELRYLLADDGAQKSLYSLDGRDRLMGSIAQLEVVHDLGPYFKGAGVDDRAALMVQRAGEPGCRLYDARLRLLVPHAFARSYGRCTAVSARPYVYAQTANGEVQAYRVERGLHLQRLGTVPGELVHGDAAGYLIVRELRGERPVYRLYGTDGRLRSDLAFDRVEPAGCNIFHLVLGDQWWLVTHDGQVVNRRVHPFSC